MHSDFRKSFFNLFFFLFSVFFLSSGFLLFEVSHEKKFSSFCLLYIYLILFYLHSTFFIELIFIHLLLYYFLNGCKLVLFIASARDQTNCGELPDSNGSQARLQVGLKTC